MYTYYIYCYYIFSHSLIYFLGIGDVQVTLHPRNLQGNFKQTDKHTNHIKFHTKHRVVNEQTQHHYFIIYVYKVVMRKRHQFLTPHLDIKLHINQAN